MEFIDKVLSFSLENRLFDGRTLIVGCSGGPDSVALLKLLPELTDSKIHAVHVNHGLRPEASADEDFVKSLCEDMGIPLKIFRFDVRKESEKMSRSEEETGRILRYGAFEEYATELFGEDKDKKSVIVLAHHKDDLAETMLMNIFRGTGLEGLISPKAKSERAIRPLLCVSKQEILNFLEETGQDFCEDKTNREEICTRNIWRNKIIPQIAEVSVKEPGNALFETYELLSDDMDLINVLTSEKIRDHLDTEHLILDTRAFEDCHKAIAGRLIRMLWKMTFGDLTDFEKKHVMSVYVMATDKGASGRTLDLPFRRKAFISGTKLGFTDENKIREGFSRAVFSTGCFVFDEGACDIGLSKAQNTAVLPKSHIKIKTEIIENIEAIRYNTNSWFYPLGYGDPADEIMIGPLDGDLTFRRAGTDLEIKVCKLLGTYKIPASLRRDVLGVRLGNEVLWIPGIGHSAGFTDEISARRFLEDQSEGNKTGRFLALHLSEVKDERC